MPGGTRKSTRWRRQALVVGVVVATVGVAGLCDAVLADFSSRAIPAVVLVSIAVGNLAAGLAFLAIPFVDRRREQEA
jgi:hypothetical protein